MRILCLGIPEFVRLDLQSRGCALFEAAGLKDLCSIVKVCNSDFLDQEYLDVALINLDKKISIFGLKRIRDYGIKIPIVCITKESVSRVIFFKQGGNYLITEPWDLDELYESIKSICSIIQMQK